MLTTNPVEIFRPYLKPVFCNCLTETCLLNLNKTMISGVEAGKKAAAEVLALQKRVLSVLNEAT